MDQIDLLTDPGQVLCIGYRYIAAADDRCCQSAVECAVAHRAVADAHAGQLFLTRDAEQPVIRTGRNDDSLRFVGILFALHDHLSGLGMLNGGHLVLDDRHAEGIHMLAHLHAQFESVDAGQCRIVIDLGRVDDLAAAAGKRFDDGCIQSGTVRINRGCEARRAGADDDNISHDCTPS